MVDRLPGLQSPADREQSLRELVLLDDPARDTGFPTPWAAAMTGQTCWRSTICCRVSMP